MNSKVLGALSLLIIFMAACGSPIEENMSRDVESFKAINQDGEKIILPDDYEGQYWIADFIFTSCETVCPPMTGNMSRLQTQLNEANLKASLVSISVDPKNDTKQKLKTFAEPYQPDYDRWSFLTGYTFQDVKELSIKSFQAPLKNLESSTQVAHGTSFYLVSPKGEVIKSYKGTEAENMSQIVDDLKALTSS